MHLHEEYIKRRNIQVPYILFVDRAVVVLQNRHNPFQYRITKLKWRSFTHRPGVYELLTYEPSQIEPLSSWLTPTEPSNESFYWNELPCQIGSYLNKVKSNYRAVQGDHRFFGLWSMFLFAFDAVISRHSKSDDLYKNIELSTRCDLSIGDRTSSWRNVMRSLPDYLTDIFNHQICSLLDGQGTQSEWLENLINENS